MSRIYLSPPDVGVEERERLLAAVESGWVAPVGPDLDAFEAEVAQVCGRRFGVGLSSGTAALHLALLELGVGPGDEVLVSTFTFAASAYAVAYVGATPVFVDADSSTWQISPTLVAEALDARDGRVKAAVVVDLYGQCADYDSITPLLDAYGVALVEDAAEALGATYRGRPAGSFGAVGAVSFNGNKIITTSGGGMLVTDSPDLASRCRYLSTQARQPLPHYEHTEIGFNYRLSNLLAAFGRGQLAGLDRRVRARQEINSRYRNALGEIPGVSFMPHATYGASSHWLTCITLDAKEACLSPTELRVALEVSDIEARPTWKPMHLQPVFSDAPAHVDGTSERLFETGLCLPSGSSMTEEDQGRVIDAVRAALDR